MTRHEQSNGTRPLLRPARLGDLRLPNRVVMAPLTRSRAAAGDLVPTDLHAAYYAQRATAGLIITEGAWVSEQAIGFPRVPGIYSEPQVAAWRRVTSVVHALGGRIVLQLWHAGARDAATPQAMTLTGIKSVISDYATAAARARRAGFDGVEVAANGTYLIAQFLNRRLNRRADEFGAPGHRLVHEIVGAVAAAWDGRRAGVRLSPYWGAADRSAAGQPRGAYPYAPDEETLASYDALVAGLSEHRVTYLHLRGRAPAGPGADPDFDAIARYRALFGGFLIANHGFGPGTGDAIVGAGLADAVSFARLFIANPDLVSRFALGHELATSDRSTHYRGGARGYTDYPIWAPSGASR